MTTELNLKSDSRLELAFGRVHPGAEKWMAEKYFATMGPVMAANGFERLASAGVIETNATGTAPAIVVFSAWPKADNRAAFLADPGFVAIRAERDARLEMSDGHLFEPIDEIVAIKTEKDYAVVIAEDSANLNEPVISLPLSADSHDPTFAGKSMTLSPWSVACEDLLKGDPQRAIIFRVRFEPSN